LIIVGEAAKHMPAENRRETLQNIVPHCNPLQKNAPKTKSKHKFKPKKAILRCTYPPKIAAQPSKQRPKSTLSVEFHPEDRGKM
jgi:hypothetical protein